MGSPTIIPTRSRRVRILLLTGAMLLGGAAPAMAAEPTAARESITLEQAITQALAHDPRVVQAKGDQAIAAAAQKRAFGEYLPKLAATASTGASQAVTPDTLTVQGSGSAGIALSYDVFTGFRRGAEETQAQAQAQAAEAGLSANGADVALGVEETFFQALQAKELLEVANVRLKSAEEGLAAAKRKADAGLGTQSDELRAQVELNSAQQALLSAQTQADTAAFALGREIGVDGPVDAQVDAAPQGVDASFDAQTFLADLLQHAPALVSAEAQASAATAGVQVAKSSYLPQVSASAGYDWATARGGPAFPGDSGWSVKLGVSLPIFDGFARDEAMTKAEAQQRTAEASLADTRRSLRATAEQLIGQLQLASSKITLAEQSVAAADEDLRVQQQRYAMGVSTMLELLTSQTGDTQAKTDLVQARFDYRLAKAQLLSLAGRPS